MISDDGTDLNSYYTKSNDQTYVFPMWGANDYIIIVSSVMQNFESNTITRYPIRIHYYSNSLDQDSNIDFVDGTPGYIHHDDSDELYFSDNGQPYADGVIKHYITLSGGNQYHQANLSITNKLDDYILGDWVNSCDATNASFSTDNRHLARC